MTRATWVVLAVVAAGCAAADGDATTHALHQVHDFAQGPRDFTFRVSREADEVRARLAMEPRDACLVREPTRVVLVAPDGREALALAAPADCRGEAADPRLPAEPGAWTLRFEGNATVLASADVRVVDHPRGRGYVASP